MAAADLATSRSGQESNPGHVLNARRCDGDRSLADGRWKTADSNQRTGGRADSTPIVRFKETDYGRTASVARARRESCDPTGRARRRLSLADPGTSYDRVVWNRSKSHAIF